MKKQTFAERCLCLSLSFVLALSLVACSGSDSNEVSSEAPSTELSEAQKDDIKGIVYDIVPKALFVMRNGESGQAAFIENSTHVTENFRESVIESTRKRSVALYNSLGSGYVTSTVFTSHPAVTITDFYDYYYENGTYSVTVRMLLTCTLQKKEFGGAWREGTPYQETSAYECCVYWNEKGEFQIASLYSA